MRGADVQVGPCLLEGVFERRVGAGIGLARIERSVVRDDVVAALTGPLPADRRSRRDPDGGGSEPERAAVGVDADFDDYPVVAPPVDDAVDVAHVVEPAVEPVRLGGHRTGPPASAAPPRTPAADRSAVRLVIPSRVMVPSRVDAGPRGPRSGRRRSGPAVAVGSSPRRGRRGLRCRPERHSWPLPPGEYKRQLGFPGTENTPRHYGTV